MIIYPAVDIIDGQVVRLVKGDYDQKTIYHDDPVGQAEEFAKEGAEWLHIVDLEAARSGGSNLHSLVSRIIAKASVCVQLGGGIRSLEDIQRWQDAGIHRVVLGTKALEDDTFLFKACERFPDFIALALDLRAGKLKIKGWKKDAIFSLEEALNMATEAKVSAVIRTDIERDGLLTGLDESSLRQGMAADFKVSVIASGGVANLTDIKQLSDKIDGVIIGKALYERRFSLSQAIEAGRRV